ncbi:MAG: hypothetical protein KGL39_18510 [Patescibacteria group bacterium]|nr:hypothetical protein [Patescibacteria group bacterium]
MAAEMIRVEGLDQVRAELARFDAAVQDRATRAGLRRAADTVADAIEERAPVRPALPSGTALPPGALKADFGFTISRRSGVLMAVIQPGKLTRHVARWVEYGHRMVKGGYLSVKRGKLRGHGKEVGNVPAHPFIRPGFEASVVPAVNAFAEGLKSELKRKG